MIHIILFIMLLMSSKKKKLPLELALIPFIESNYDPFSISSSGAVGMWQFMPKLEDYMSLKSHGGMKIDMIHIDQPKLQWII